MTAAIRSAAIPAANAIASAVEPTPRVAPAAVKSAAPSPVETTAATTATVATAMLGEGRDRQANEHEGRDAYKKRLEQGGMPHICTSTETAIECPGGPTDRLC